MSYRIEYTSNKHGYVTIKDGVLLLKIPRRLQGNDDFRDLLIKKGNILLKKQKHVQNIYKQVNKKLMILIFGEWVDREKIREKSSTYMWNDEKTHTKEDQKVLSVILREYCEPVMDEYAQLLGYQWNTLSIKKMKSKRGSCSPNQNISLNLDLVHLPTRLVKYVIIHEICHLKHKHHQKSFWNELEGFLPGYKQLRKELKGHHFI